MNSQRAKNKRHLLLHVGGRRSFSSSFSFSFSLRLVHLLPSGGFYTAQPGKLIDSISSTQFPAANTGVIISLQATNRGKVDANFYQISLFVVCCSFLRSRTREVSRSIEGRKPLTFHLGTRQSQ